MYKLFKSHADYAIIGILRILGPFKVCKGPMKISKGPFKFRNSQLFEWDIGHLHYSFEYHSLNGL